MISCLHFTLGKQGLQSRWVISLHLTKQSFFCRPSPLPLPSALKIVFQLELLSDRAPLELHEPDNPDTFVSSPQRAESVKRSGVERRESHGRRTVAERTSSAYIDR
jgi:hypothetical protein